MLQTTYTDARANLASLLDEVTENQEIVIIHRRRGRSVAMIDAAVLQSLVESAHRMRPPKKRRAPACRPGHSPQRPGRDVGHRPSEGGGGPCGIRTGQRSSSPNSAKTCATKPRPTAAWPCASWNWPKPSCVTRSKASANPNPSNTSPQASGPAASPRSTGWCI